MTHRRISYSVVVLILTIVVTHELSIRRAHALTFTVTTVTDNGNNGAPTAGSLRKAIIDANANAGLDTIQFNIGGGGVQSILPPAALPTITSPVIIDGYTQPGSSVNTGTTNNTANINIVLNGSSIAASVNGLLLGAGSSGSTIKGLVINQFNGNGIRLDSSTNKVQGCFIGTGNNGNADLGNVSDGVFINNTDDHIIGTDGDGTNDLAEKNILSGNDANGVEIFGSGATGNIIKGNFIGTNASGASGLGNSLDGVEIELSINNTVGGTTANERNIISANGSDGVEIHGIGATGNLIQGNYIGTSSLGTVDLGNAVNGVNINAVPSNTVGGTTATPGTAAGNVISGNNSDGVEISGNAATGNTVAGNIIGLNAAGTGGLGNNDEGVFIVAGVGNTIGGTTTTARNVISGNSLQGVALVSDADSNLIKANFIGTNAAGTAAIGNSQGGIVLATNSSSNTIGGMTAAERNVISGNTSEGIEISTSADNSVFGNYIGTDATGNADLGNTTDGVKVTSGPNNLIGNTSLGAGNVISGNDANGVSITTQTAIATAIRVAGNIIGLNAAGTTDLGNNLDGIHITESTNVVIGNATVINGRNIISGNNNNGVLIEGVTPATSTATLVQGNFIGTDISGTLARGNSQAGVFVTVASNGNTIGGPGNARNVISGNGTRGVFLDNDFGGSLVQNNFIGTDVTGVNPVGNSGEGVRIIGSSNTIGGVAALGNIIAFNAADGVRVLTGTGNAIFANSIFSNGTVSGDIGIDINNNGITPNDVLDPDTGTNNLQNFPVITSAIRNNGNNTTTILGSLDSTPDTTFTLQFFSSPSCDGSGNGQGQTYLGSTTVHTTIDDSPVSFIIAFSPALPLGNVITATAIDAARNTSEFSACRTVIGDSPTSIEFASASATRFDDGVFIRWRTGMEVNNLGFNLYRENGGTLEAVNKQLIAGSALMFAADVELRSGHAYEWWDARPADKATAYWIEDHDLNGQSSWHGPFYSSPGTEKERPLSIQQAKALAVLGVTDSASTRSESLAKLPTLTSPSGALKLTAKLPTPESGTAIKIAIKHEGWYRLSQAELTGAGLSRSTDPRLLQLFVDGKQQPMVVNGQDDGLFDPSDSIEFYGTGIDSPFSNARSYYLVAGQQAGQRVSQIRSFAPPQRGGSFDYTVERRERTIYFSALLNGDRENFFGAVIASQPVAQTLTLEHIDLNAHVPALLKVALQGVTNIDHVVSIEVNGSFAGHLRFQAQASGATTLSIPHSMLQEGANVVRLIPQGGPSDVSLVDSVQLTYEHTFSADDNALRFKASGGQAVTVEGFSDPAIRVFDVTEPSAVKEIQGAIEKHEDKQVGSTASVTFTAPGNGPRTLFAVTDSGAKRPDNVAVDSPSNLRGTVQNAELVIVTSREFVDQAGSLKNYRQSQGLSAAVVDIEDIYDEFSFGQKSPQAVREFLSFASRNWRTRYALLLGDASFDPKNYLGLGNTDLVPTRLLDTVFMETASDDWLADFDQNGIADIAIGRLPARTSAEAETMIGKIITYEKSQVSNEALLVSDRNEGFNFELTNSRLIPLLPQSTTATHLKRAVMGDAATKAAAIDAINRGPKIVSYAGHGSANVWRGNTLTGVDARALQNRERPTIFAILNCLNGYFQDPSNESLSEALMRNENGGAVAAWASSAMTFADGQVSLSQEFYRQVFANRARIGDAAIKAKATTGDADVRRTWILFGDPSMRMTW